jgi:hypothetical protein
LPLPSLRLLTVHVCLPLPNQSFTVNNPNLKEGRGNQTFTVNNLKEGRGNQTFTVNNLKEGRGNQSFTGWVINCK